MSDLTDHYPLFVSILIGSESLSQPNLVFSRDHSYEYSTKLISEIEQTFKFSSSAEI